MSVYNRCSSQGVPQIAAGRSSAGSGSVRRPRPRLLRRHRAPSRAAASGAEPGFWRRPADFFHESPSHHWGIKQLTCPKFTGEILLSEELIFSLIVCLCQKAGISAEPERETCFHRPVLDDKMSYIHKRRRGPLPGLLALRSEVLSITGPCIFFFSELHFFFCSFKIVPTPMPSNL